MSKEHYNYFMKLWIDNFWIIISINWYFLILAFLSNYFLYIHWFYIDLILFTETSVYIKSHAIKYRKLHKYIDYLLGCHPHLHNQQFIDMHICIYTLLVLTLLRKHGKTFIHLQKNRLDKINKMRKFVCINEESQQYPIVVEENHQWRCVRFPENAWTFFVIIVSQLYIKLFDFRPDFDYTSQYKNLVTKDH